MVALPRITDVRGNLTFIESGTHIPFMVKRVYYIYDVPGGEGRGAHAHRELHQLMVAVSGSFKVDLDDGNVSKSHVLSRPFEGLYIPPGYWRNLTDFSSGAVCLVLVSLPYDSSDYIRDYQEFKAWRARQDRR